ncbi:MAG: acyltransferase domain-containing protein [Pseudobutyrivibrio sp.]|nr:acyltransferase domain-containing protein [Pseudobutyrivibrio sp.]
MKKQEIKFGEFDIAVIGMAGQFPKAQSIEEFWENIKEGKDCITRSGNSSELDYVNAFGKIKDIYEFDAPFFDISEYEAARMDPQQRKLLECVYHALDDAGYADRQEDKFRTGIFCSTDEPYYVWEDYYLNNNYEGTEASGIGLFIGSSVSARISYKLNLTGPCITARAACATSLTTIHMACQSLLGYESDMTIAAASNITLDQEGYLSTENTISPDGYTRAYDDNGQGFVPGNGTAAVVLKRLSDAIKDKDNIYAVIKGSSIGNDGNRKIGYTAPSVEGEREVILHALQMAGLSSRDIGYIEGHGTATPLGDAVELKALKSIMEKPEDDKPYCAIGSVKSNVGHLNMTAGIAGFIKAVLCVKENVIPPSLHCEELNKELNEIGCPIYVADETASWNKENVRIAGVSSFGIGGINAHIIVQEPPAIDYNETEKEVIIPYSAKTIASLTNHRDKLLEYMQNRAATLSAISGMYKYHKPNNRYRDYIIWNKKQCVFAGDVNAAKKISDELFSESKVVFLFPGGGSQVTDMGQNLYGENTTFRKYMDECFDILEQKEGLNFKEKMQKKEPLENPTVLEALAMIFSVDYSLAMFLQECGVKPDYVLGSSLGEYAACCVAGIISLEDALKMVASRGKLFENIPDSSMLTISASAEEVGKYLTGEDSLSISGINSDKRTVVSGLHEDLQNLKNRLQSDGIMSVYLKAGKAAHCSLVDPILDDYEKSISDIEYSDMKISVVSSYAGRKVSNEEVSNSLFWRKHMREPVRFFDAVKDLSNDEKIIFIETGIGNQLSSFVNKIVDGTENKIISMIADPKITEYENILKGIGEIWRCGKSIEWPIVDESDTRTSNKVRVPEYVFDKNEYKHTTISRIGNYNSSSYTKHLIIDGLTEEKYLRTKYIIENQANQCLLVEDSAERNRTGIDNVQVEKTMNSIQSDYFNHDDITLVSEIPGYDKTAKSLMVSCIADYFKKNLTFDGKIQYTHGELYKTFRIKKEFQAFFNYLLDVLREEDLVVVINGKISFSEQLNKVKTSEEQLIECKAMCEEFEPLFKLCIYTSSFFEEVFTGDKKSNEVIYPEGKYDMLAAVYDKLPNTTYRYECIEMLASMLQKLIADNERKIRILEIGAGTAEMTEILMSKIGDKNIEYWFTDISASFISLYGQSGKLSQHKNIKYQVFDISKSASKQGIPENYFDIVVGFDVVQATHSIEDALCNLRDVLIPGGMISLIQTYYNHPIINLIYGMSPGWWNYTKDEIRGSSIVLKPDEWVYELQKMGFMNAINYPTNANISDAGLFIAFKENRIKNDSRLFVNEKKEDRYKQLLSKAKNIQVVFLDCDSKETLEAELHKKGYELDEYECIYPEEWNAQDEERTEDYDEITNKVIQLIKGVLGSKAFDANTAFEELGIDSLSALIMISRLKSMFHQQIGVDVLYQNNTVASLSDYIRQNVVESDNTEENETIVAHQDVEKGLLDLIEEN